MFFIEEEHAVGDVATVGNRAQRAGAVEPAINTAAAVTAERSRPRAIVGLAVLTQEPSSLAHSVSAIMFSPDDR